jgi:energy-coupling factor transporter ATP-binding protein EcfA2
MKKIMEITDLDDAELLTNYKPNIFDIHRYFENYIERGKYKPIVGNYEARTTIALLFPLRGVSVVVKGPAGSGKSTIIKCASQLIWGEGVFENKVKEVLYIAGSSDKGLLTDSLASRIAHVCSHCVVPELQNAVANERVEAIIKLWTEGEAYHYVRGANAGTINREITLKPLPILTSIATENKYTQMLGEEMERRFMPFYTIAKGELNKQIHQTKADSWAKCDEDLINMTDSDKTDLRLHLQQSANLKDKVKNPSALYMKDSIPSGYVVSNSMIEYWFELVAAVSKFYHTERMFYVSPKGRQSYLLCTPADNWTAWKLGGAAIVFASMNVPDLGREIIEMLPMRDMNCLDAGETLNEVVDELQGLGIERTKKQVQQIMKALESVNYAKRDDYQHEKFYRTKSYDFSISVNWPECIEATKKAIKELYPEIAKNYIHEFCSDPTVIDPFTDKKIKLMDVPYEKPDIPKQKEIIDLRKYINGMGD